jgi:FKBP-type peptidyl-prolyl cis-trans isomerase
MTRVLTLLAVGVVFSSFASSSAVAQKDDKNKDKSDVREKKWVTTATGLQYMDEKVGNGAIARAGDRVEVYYTGTYKDGRKFDGNKDSGKPYGVTVGAAQVIKGWDEGLMGMKVGGVRKLIIPYQLGYGEKGGNGIPPKTELHFEIELVRIK